MDVPANTDHEVLLRERNKSWMLRAWILSGIFFMALPGTLLGFSNLKEISAHHGLGSMPPAWIGVQSLPVVQSNVLESYKTVFKKDPPPQLADACKKAAPACG